MMGPWMSIDALLLPKRNEEGPFCKIMLLCCFYWVARWGVGLRSWDLGLHAELYCKTHARS